MAIGYLVERSWSNYTIEVDALLHCERSATSDAGNKLKFLWSVPFSNARQVHNTNASGPICQYAGDDAFYSFGATHSGRLPPTLASNLSMTPSTKQSSSMRELLRHGLTLSRLGAAGHRFCVMAPNARTDD